MSAVSRCDARAVRVKLVLLVVLALVVGAGVAVGLRTTDDATGEPRPVSQAELRRVQHRIDDSQLERQGIFVASTGPTESGGVECVGIEMLNPTAPNRAWLRARFGPHVCPSTKPAGGFASTLIGCGGGEGPDVQVPDVVGLRADYALRRLRRAGFAEDCNNDTKGRRPDRFSPQNALFVAGVCVTSAPRGSVTQMKVRGRLPGGYRYTEDGCE